MFFSTQALPKTGGHVLITKIGSVENWFILIDFVALDISDQVGYFCRVSEP
jgi:hypothetical protein